MPCFIEHTMPDTGHDSVGRFNQAIWKYDTLKEAVKNMDRLKSPTLYIGQRATLDHNTLHEIEKIKQELKDEARAEAQKEIDDEIKRLEKQKKNLQ